MMEVLSFIKGVYIRLFFILWVIACQRQ